MLKRQIMMETCIYFWELCWLFQALMGSLSTLLSLLSTCYIPRQSESGLQHKQNTPRPLVALGQVERTGGLSVILGAGPRWCKGKFHPSAGGQDSFGEGRPPRARHLNWVMKNRWGFSGWRKRGKAEGMRCTKA